MARETKRMLQIGSQHRSTPFKIRAMQAVQQGLIGKVYIAKGLCFKRRAVDRHSAQDEPTSAGRELGSVPRARAAAAVQRVALQVQLALVLGHRQRRHRQPGRARDGGRSVGLGDPEWPKTA